MPQELIVIFLLFFAALAFGWFYWQRAKARAIGTTTPAAATDAPAADAPVVEEQSADPSTTRTDPPA